MKNKLYCHHCWGDITDLNGIIVNQEMESVFCCEECAESEIEDRIEAYKNDNVPYVGNECLKETLEHWGFDIEKS